MKKTNLVPQALNPWICAALALIGPLVALWVWASALSFVPVPWPDDSAFYFVAKELFRWPPRWVMLPQAPFEPTYRIWNFNTMPLYPWIIGLGRFIGIDGSHGLKFWPLGFWAATSSFAAVTLYRARLPIALAALVALLLALDPTDRWASVLVRPESLIAFIGAVLVFGLCLGWYDDQESRFWDPVAALLAVGAYAHFNAVHLLFALVPWLIFRPRRTFSIGWKCALYLSPWILTVVLKPLLFVQQMALQWQRLAIPNGWLSSWTSAMHGLFQNLGSPEDWPPELYNSAPLLWLLILSAIAFGLILPAGLTLLRWYQEKHVSVPGAAADGVALAPAAAWVVATLWLWNGKPEVWFVYYIHIALWCFVGIALLKLWRMRERENVLRNTAPLFALISLTVALAFTFAQVDWAQAERLGKSASWTWDSYHDYISCIDRQLVRIEAHGHKNGKQFQVWEPTFPDATVELSLRHPEWDFTRTNDFPSRTMLAIRHGIDVDAVVITEELNWQEREIDAPWPEHPEVHSVWMDWHDYFLSRFMTIQGWKPTRYLCQKGRWQAFIFSD